MKFYLLCIGAVLVTTFVTGQHSHHHSSGGIKKEVSLNHLLDGFDAEKALQEMNEKGIPESDRTSYLRYLKASYIKNAHPEFNFSDLLENTFYNFIPSGSAQQTRSIYCTNADFELYDFSNWLGGLSYYGSGFTNTTIQSNGTNASIFDISARHTIVTTPALNNDPTLGAIVGYDELAISPTTGLAEISLVAPNGGTASCRLGNANTGSEIERLYYDMNVTASNTTFYYQFAIVLQDPAHTVSEQPYFKITVKDGNGNQIGGVCGVYNVNATLASSDASFVQTTYGGEALYYRPWELVSVDLAAYVGTTVRIEFETADCSLGGHFGYAYIDAGCGMLDLASSFCSADDSALIVAPQGFNEYQWYGPNDDNLIMPGETSDSLFIANPIINDTFYVSLESASGCISELAAVLQYTTVTAGFIQINNSCPGGASGSATVLGQGSTSGYTYLWTPGNFTTSTITNLAPGNYNVHIEANDPNCGAFDTLITIGTNPVLPLNITSNFCAGGNSFAIAPAGGSNYQWYNSSQTAVAAPQGINDTLAVSNPFTGQEYYVSYISAQGCNDSAIVDMNQTFLSGFFNVSAGTCGQATISYNFSTSPTFTYDITGPSYSNTISNTSQTNINLTGLAPGSYSATVYDAGCSATSAFDIIYTVNNNSQNVALCPLGTQTLTSPTSGTHIWTDPLGNQAFSTITLYTMPSSPPTPGTYVDSVILSGGCLEINTFIVTVTPTTIQPVQNLNPCPLDDVTVTSSSSGTHHWTDQSGASLGTTSSTSFTITDILPGSYTDSCVTTAGCVVISEYSVTYNSIVTNVINSDVGCYADSNATASVVIVSGPTSGTYSYNWSGTLSYNATGSSQNDLYAGTFIIVTTNGNCTTSDTITVNSPVQPADTLFITTAFCELDPYAVLYAPDGFTNYQWYFDNQILSGETNDSIVITNLAAYTDYSVTYETPPNGCIRRTTFINRMPAVNQFIPSVYNNVFSPNADSKNELYYPFFTLLTPGEIAMYTEEYEIYIYNRWGELLFTSTSYTNAWDGKYKGKECSEGVYYWTILFTSKCGDGSEPTEVNGTVHLMR